MTDSDPPRLLELSVDTTAEGVDWVCALLAPPAHPADLVGAPPEPADRVVGAPHEPAVLVVGAPHEPAWPIGVRAYLPAATSRAALVRLDESLEPLRRMGLAGDLRVDRVGEPPAGPSTPATRVGGRFVVVAPGAGAGLAPGDLPIEVVPGPAFGSGLHPATVCSLRLIERHAARGMRALDLGSGSGVLSVALARLGARVLALDNDPVAVAATEQTVRRNRVAADVRVERGSLGAGAGAGHWLGSTELEPAPALAASGQFDLIAANVLARLHVGLAADYRAALRAGGRLITAGYTRDQAGDVERSLTEAGLRPLDRVEEGEYVGLAHRADA